MQSLRAFLAAIIVTTSLVYNLQAQPNPQKSGIVVSFDFQSAQSVCKLLAQKKADTTQIAAASKLYGNTLLIQKVKGYSGSGEDIFKSTLKEILQTGTIKGNDPYNFKQVKSNLPAIQKLLDYLSTSQQNFTNQVKDIIATYTPKDLSAETKACFLVGGGSLGFTIGNDPTFNVALQQIGDDIEGLKHLVAHELYHTIQDVGQSKRVKLASEKAPYSIRATNALLYNLWAEGTANYVGDFDKIKTSKPFTAKQQQQSLKNSQRQIQNFYLFETLLYRQYTDTIAKYQPLYDIAFSNAFDETSYAVGYEMAKKISEYQGENALANLLTQDPIIFTQTYISLYNSKPGDKSFIRFSLTMEKVVEKMLLWKDKI